MPPIEHTERGRWGGRLTNKPLPETDPTIDALPKHLRAYLADTWMLRAGMERRVADSFEVVRDALVRLRAAPELVDLAVRAIDDEYRHAELSRVVASRFAGEELAAPPRLPLEVPKHKGASPELRDTLHVVGQCVLNETTASVFLETCLAEAKGPLAKTALAELLSDEIDHGRIGWTHLASLPRPTRVAIEPWLLPMAYLNLRIWRHESAIDSAHVAVLAEHGVPHGKIIHEALVDALRTLIIPGFKELGIATTRIEAWLAAGASTDELPA